MLVYTHSKGTNNIRNLRPQCCTCWCCWTDIEWNRILELAVCCLYFNRVYARSESFRQVDREDCPPGSVIKIIVVNMDGFISRFGFVQSDSALSQPCPVTALVRTFISWPSAPVSDTSKILSPDTPTGKFHLARTELPAQAVFIVGLSRRPLKKFVGIDDASSGVFAKLAANVRTKGLKMSASWPRPLLDQV